MDLDNQNLYLSDAAKSYLKETAGWSKFLAIFGFVMLALLVILGLSMGAIFSTVFSSLPEMETQDMPFPASGLGASMGIIYVIMAVIYFFPLYYLYKFSSKVKLALEQNDEPTLTESFNFLKRHYKYVGILLIIMLAFQIIAFITMIIGAGMGAMS